MAGDRQLPMANEVVLDVLKFLNYTNLCQIEQSARILRQLVDRYRFELPLCQFHQLQIFAEPAVSLTTYRRALEITECCADENGEFVPNLLGFGVQQMEGWHKLIDDQIPVYSFPDISLVSQIERDQIESFLLFITKEDGPRQPKLCVELPLYPETEQDLVLIRFWLDQLRRVHFQWMDCGRVFFNPELLGVLYSGSRRAPTFHCSRLELKVGIPDEQHNGRFVQFVRNNVVVTECLTLRCGLYFEGVLDLLLNAGTRIAKVVIPVGPAHSTVELQNLIIYHAECSLDPMALVGCIEFQNVDDFQWPDLRSAKCVGKEMGNALVFKEYFLANVHDPNVGFAISIGHLHGGEEFKRFMIQRRVLSEEK